MMPSEKLRPLETADAELVAQAQSGDRDAFGRIVARYQALICAVAYNATGGLTQSEDLAQDAFVVAWKQLPFLREPEKLRSWLCGIVRNLSRRARRDEKFEPVLRAEQLEVADELPALEPHPLDQAISREEEGILWRQLEDIPETYREPLILYYRQHASIEQVALALELSEDAVRQRLSRGRKLLQEQVLAFVESALERTSPKPAFTQHVLAALPAAASSAKAVGAGLAAASGSAAKGAWAAAGPLGSVFALFGGALVTRKGMTDGAKSPREQQFVNRIAWVQAAVVFPFLAIAWIIARGWSSRSPLVRDMEFFAFFFSVWAFTTRLWRWRSIRQRQIQIEDHTLDEAEWRPQPRGGGGPKRPPGAPPFSVHLKRSVFSFVFLAVWAFRAPWKDHFTQALVAYVCVPTLLLLLVVLLGWRLGFRNRSRYLRPSLVFLVGFPVTITLLVMDFDLFTAWTRGDVSIEAIVLTNAAVILAFGAWPRIFLRIPKPSLR